MIRVAFATLILSLSVLLQASFIFDSDLDFPKKTVDKLKEMGDELYEKAHISTVIVAKKHLDQKEFLNIKDSYLKELKDPYILWIFSKTYIDRENIGINQMFNSKDLEDKFDRDSMFSPFFGSFTKLVSIQKSKSDPLPAAFLNGYADLVDMLSKSQGIKLDSSIGNETRVTMDIFRVIFYLVLLFFFGWYLKVKFFKKGE